MRHMYSVIPGRREAANPAIPQSILPVGGYGFRDRVLRTRLGMTACDAPYRRPNRRSISASFNST
jgi:hypothetical protein